MPIYIYDSRVMKWLGPKIGMQAITLWCFVLYAVPKEEIVASSFVHERQHMLQYARWGWIGAVLTFLLSMILGISGLWMIPAALFSYTVRYESELIFRRITLGSWKASYDKNSLEQEARRVAGEPER